MVFESYSLPIGLNILQMSIFSLFKDDLYTAQHQEDEFNKVFGEAAQLADHETKKCNYYSRNHLTPHADFATIANQVLTYFFQNCFPGKQSMNAQVCSSILFRNNLVKNYFLSHFYF